MELTSRDPFATFRRAAVAAVAALAITWPAMLSARAQAPSNFSRDLSVRQLSGRPARRRSSGMPPPPRLTIAPRCAVIRATTSFSAAPSWPCWPTARSTRRSSSPSAFCRSTRPIASRGWCSGCARSSRSSIRSRAANSPSRSAARSPILPRLCCRHGRWRARPRSRPRPTPSTSCRAGLVRDLQGSACRA